MEYNRIVAVTGLSGLFEVVGSKSDGAIVRSLEDGTTKFVSSRIHNLSHLESIEVYTNRENISLSELFTSMKSNGAALPDVKDNKALKSYFEKVYPDMDFERVYSSDMKKMVKWYEILQKNDVDFSYVAPTEEGETEEAAAEPVAQAAEEAPAEKKTRAKKTKAAEGDSEAPAAEAAEKPKRAPRKKKSEE